MKNNRLLFWSITVALAGFLFGFDTVVISGAEKTLQSIWQTSDLFHGWVVVSMALWGTVIGAIFGGIPTEKLGRKTTLIWIGALYFISAIGSGLAQGPYMFAFFRFIGGLGVGASTIAAPAYVSEIAPADRRGRLVALYQFNIVLGILVAFVSNYLLSGVGENAWRWMVGIEAVPALAYFLLVMRVPKSPRWLLVHRHATDEAREILRRINPDAGTMEIEQTIQLVQSNEASARSAARGWASLRRYRYLFLLAFLIAFFNQFSGINAFLYYAPRIFEEAGLGASTALLSSIGIGVTNLVFTILGLTLIDRLGRRQLMYVGSVGYILSLATVSMAFLNNWAGMVVPVALFAFIAAHAIGQGAVIWVFISEIFPNHLRAYGQSFGSSVHWVLAALIPALVPYLFQHPRIGAWMVFGFFAFMMVFQLLFVIFLMPETKGVSLEDLQDQLVKPALSPQEPLSRQSAAL